MKTIKPVHLKRVIDFIHSNDNQYCGKELRRLFNNDLNKFVQLLHEAVKSAEVVPNVVIPFYRKISEMNNIKPSENLEENIMKPCNQSNHKKETSFISKIIEAVKSAYTTVKSFITRNIKKVSLVGAVVATVAIAKVAGLNLGLVMAIAALKGKAMMSYLVGLAVNLAELAVRAKVFIIDNANKLFPFCKAGGQLIWSKVIETKNLIITKVRQFISWIAGVINTEQREYSQAA